MMHEFHVAGHIFLNAYTLKKYHEVLRSLMESRKSQEVLWSILKFNEILENLLTFLQLF